MIIKKLRLEKGWSQEQLAQLSGVSARTIQRVEGGQKAGLETMKCLAAVFEIDVANLMQEHTMSTHSNTGKKEKGREKDEGVEYVQNLKAFHLSWIAFVIIIPCLYALNAYLTPEYLWIFWVIGGWGLGIALHALVIFGLFNIFDKKWEKRELSKRQSRHS